MICTNEIASVAVKNCIKEIRKWLYYSSRILIRVECGRVKEGALELVFTPEILICIPLLQPSPPSFLESVLIHCSYLWECVIWFQLCWMWGERKRLENKKSSSTTLFLLKVWKFPRDYVGSQQTPMYNHTCIWLLKMVLFLMISSVWICLKTQTK